MEHPANDVVTLELDGDVAVIRLDDGKVNALTPAALERLDELVHQARNEARAVVLAGRPGRFSAGFDLTTMKSGIAPARSLLGAGARLAEALYTSPVPVVMACTGHALAMGAILLLSGDVRVGADGPFKIGLNEVAIGMPVPRFVVELATERLSTRARNAALQLATVAAPADAVEAGFLDLLAEPDAVVPTAVATAHELADRLDPTAFRLTRGYLRDRSAERFTAALSADLDTFVVAAD